MGDLILLECIKEARSPPDSDNRRVVKDYESFTVRPRKSHSLDKENKELDNNHCAVDNGTFGNFRFGPSVVDSVTSLIGHTPIIRLKKMEEAYDVINCELYAKLEFMSVGGSVKDRIGRRMILDAQDRLRKGDYIVEATSGNTGIALAMMCAVEGYRMICFMPQKISMEKENCLTALGATVIRTRNSARWDDHDSHITLAEKLVRALNDRSDRNEGRKAYFLDQYSSQSNIDTHYNETAEEILQQMGRSLDYFVAGAGTGGTFSGTSLRLKELIPNLKCIAVDPKGSVLHRKKGGYDMCKDVKPFEVEGVGYDFHPSTWHQDIADDFEIVNDYETFETARQLIRMEGVLCGGSCGLALAGAIKHARKIGPKDKKPKMLVLFPDSIRNYLSKFVSDDWMLAHNLFPKPSDHRLYREDQSVISAAPLSYNVALKALSTHTLIDTWQNLIDSEKSHAAIVEASTGALLAVVSKEAAEDLIIKGYSSISVGELANKSSIYIIDEHKAGMIDELRLVLGAQFAEGKLPYPAVIIKPECINIEGRPTDPVGLRNSYINEDWKNVEIRVVTPEIFIRQYMSGKNVS